MESSSDLGQATAYLAKRGLTSVLSSSSTYDPLHGSPTEPCTGPAAVKTSLHRISNQIRCIPTAPSRGERRPQQLIGDPALVGRAHRGATLPRCTVGSPQTETLPILYRASIPCGRGKGPPRQRGNAMSDFVARLTRATVGSLDPGEAISHGAVCMSVGGMRRRSLSAMGGVIGVLANNVVGEPADHALNGNPLPRDLAVGLTDRRVLLVSMSAVTGRPSRVVAAIPLSDVGGVEVTTGTSLGMKLHYVTLSLRDGSSLSLESRCAERPRKSCALRWPWLSSPRNPPGPHCERGPDIRHCAGSGAESDTGGIRFVRPSRTNEGDPDLGCRRRAGWRRPDLQRGYLRGGVK